MTRLLLAFCLLVSLPASARDGRDGNGGTEIALEFKQLGAKAIAAVQASPALYPEVSGHDLTARLDGASVIVSPEPLFVMKGNLVQECTAKNYRDPDTILISRPNWKQIQSEPVKQALAFHEVLGLAGIEGTGDYRVSNRYLRNLGVECASGLCDFGEEATYGPMKFHAICHGAGRGKCVNPPDSARARDKYPVIGGGSCEAPAHDFLDPFEQWEPYDDSKFSCDAEGVRGCIRLSLEAGLNACREKAQKRGWNRADLESCQRHARAEVARRAKDTGIATDGRCYVVIP